MNRKGKNPLTTKGAKAGSKRQVNQNRGLFNFKGDSAVAKNLVKSKRKTAQAKATVDHNSRLKPNFAAKKNLAKSGSAKKNSLSQPKKPRLALRSAIYALTIVVGLSTILGTLVSNNRHPITTASIALPP